jgi:chemotaxis response regulator CheB
MVLVVDDDAFMRSLLGRLLTSAVMRIESGAPGGDHGQ